MKHVFIYSIVSFILSAFTVVASTAISDIINAFKQGNATEISKYLENYVDIKLPNKDEAKNISKNQATQTLKDFYTSNSINGFELSSQRELGGTGYLTGKIKSDNKSFSITVMIKTKDNLSSIVSIRIN
ncbi:MAG: DUF4783 domain-containing protein [Arachidicoccus sp.]|nr:DUF4783 domain-containing protein [Arachidicoccus sp.]